MTFREYQRTLSNNDTNPNKNICTSAVAKALGVKDAIRYLQTVDDVVRATRTRYTVRSRMSNVKGMSVGKARAKAQQITENEDGKVVGYLAVVKGHILLLDNEGKTIVDTAPRKRDKRKLTHFYVVIL